MDSLADGLGRLMVLVRVSVECVVEAVQAKLSGVPVQCTLIVRILLLQVVDVRIGLLEDGRGWGAAGACGRAALSSDGGRWGWFG